MFVSFLSIIYHASSSSTTCAIDLEEQQQHCNKKDAAKDYVNLSFRTVLWMRMLVAVMCVVGGPPPQYGQEQRHQPEDSGSKTDATRIPTP